MSDPHEIRQLGSKELRQFAIVTGGIIALLFGLFFPWLFDGRIPSWPWVVALFLMVWGVAAPMSLQPVYLAWMKLGLVLSRVTTPLILGVVFYGLIFPMGLLMRLMGRDPMTRRFDNAAPSYRVKREKPPKKNMERPF